ncbi:ATP-binding protein [Plantibacter sp. VKM Ac-2880]|uniref:BbrUII/HgiDII family restriction enzyme n=1 Tax=Plantibacter sp. VKM Ac-2880 TaxID=2783827 RepID=UPI0018909469|nr:ATP-binding protein [Plantibacter sp. VKM Ac-2880]MBF4568241.1 ATP-binding protein [Plantibacter sp. VKM Ac-2880]
MESAEPTESATPTNADAERFEMKVDLAVLQSLGINLYSNAAAVLSEVVANAWDADANKISITWSQDAGSIVIEDDGSGMSLDDVNGRYLKVGYQKREPGNEGLRSSEHRRPFMGRKGIGKLSVFSLANDIVVATRKKDMQPEAFRIDRVSLETAIAGGIAYHPEPVEVPADLPPHGTRLTLTNLNTKRAGVTIRALRRRIARRFDVLSFDPAAADRFAIVINGERVGFDDREDLARIEYFWSLGASPIPATQTPAVKRRWELDGLVDEKRGWRLSGWFGSVATPNDLQDEEDERESLRNIIILARKRPIQEGILDQLHFNKLFGSYVTGQITAEFLDLDGEETPDIATSDRQRLIEDDERVTLLRTVLRERFLEAERQWTAQRPIDKFKGLMQSYPEVHAWVDERPASHRQAAQKLIQTIAALPFEDESPRRELFRAGILGFERVALDATTAQLNEFVDAVTVDDILPVLASQRTLEDALYAQILRSRIAAIEQLERLINDDDKERALQEHLFENMWLLDPSWEHPTANPEMEKSLKRIRGDVFEPSEEENKAQGRIDIKYQSAAGSHLIVELKRYGRKTTLDELFTQGAKYWEATRDVLEKQGMPSNGSNVEVIFVLGQPMNPGPIGKKTAEETIADRLDGINGRVFYYDEMLANARRQYVEYETVLAEKQGDLAKVLASLDPPVDEPEDPDEADEVATEALNEDATESAAEETADVTAVPAPPAVDPVPQTDAPSSV